MLVMLYAVMMPESRVQSKGEKRDYFELSYDVIAKNWKNCLWGVVGNDHKAIKFCKELDEKMDSFFQNDYETQIRLPLSEDEVESISLRRRYSEEI